MMKADAPPNGADPGPRRVLVVEDDEGLNLVARKILKRAGFDAEGVMTGAEAADRVMADPNQVLLLDQQLPDMTGTELVRTLKDRGQTLPFVAMTGHGDETVAVEMMKLGAREYLVKGANLTELLPKVFNRVFRELETERKLDQAQAALRVSEERFQLAMEASRDGIWDWSVETGAVYFSPSCAAMLGFGPDELPSQISAWSDRIHPDDRKPAVRVPTACIQNRTDSFRVEFRMQTREGDWRWIQARGKAVARASNGRATRLVGTHTDITDRKRAEAENARLERQFQQAQRLESVGRLAGGVAHDLNNLLSPILGFAEMLADAAGEETQRRWQAEEIVKASLRARDLVQQLLAFSRRQPLTLKPVNLNTLVESFAPLLRRTIREDIDIRFDLSPGLPKVAGDVGQLEQVIMNLAVNAQEAMPMGGALTLETGTVELAAELADPHDNLTPGPHVLLNFIDTGYGMDDNIRAHLFEPFFTTREHDKGTGLGLSIVYGIIKQHGGRICVDSEPGAGSCFTIHLPRHVGSETPDDVSETPPRRDAAKAAASAETVLLVEDNELVRGLAATILTGQGYTVLEAESGTEALESLARHEGPVHLLLTDVVMPGMNGRRLYEQVSRSHPKIRVLYMSGYNDDVISNRGVTERTPHFIQKPFSVHALTEKVREILDECEV
jgi:PAS domain S-box-containing protein